MPNYVRARVAGGCYFFTVVIRNREPLLTQLRVGRAMPADALIQTAVRSALREAIEITRERWPFHIDAWVLLPDHLHCIWTLPPDDADFSKRWSTIKRLTTKKLGKSIWQPRFWRI